jgi:hypothetical protein
MGDRVKQRSWSEVAANGKISAFSALKSVRSAAKHKMTKSKFPNDECSKTKVRGVWIFPGNDSSSALHSFMLGCFFI